MTVQEAKDAKKDVLIGSFSVGALGRAVTESDRRGLVKLIVDKKTLKILGGHIIASRAGEMIHEVALAMHVGATAKDLSTMIHAYPTYSEAITAAAGNVL
jgi:dihydrolipoamide dehydrogenase